MYSVPIVEGLSVAHEHDVSCRNVSLLKRQHKRIAAGRSSIHGWGAFLHARAEKNDIICEYTGEMVSQDEADRRGTCSSRCCRASRFAPNFTES